MIEFRINLLRDQVASSAQRRRRYQAMMAYLGLSGLLVVGAMGMASSRLVEASALREQCRRVDDLYARDHEGQGGLLAGSARLQQRVQGLAASLQALESHFSRDVRPARLIRSIMVSLPTGVSLRSLHLSREEKSVTIELVVAAGYEGQVSATDLVALWQKDSVLVEDVPDITLQGSQIESTGGKSDQVWRFLGRLKEGH